MTIGQRLKNIRLALHLKQAEFGQRIGLSQPTIGQYEKETRPITERVISQLVAEYNINEEYLRHGNGAMFCHQPTDLVTELAAKLQLTSQEQQLLLAYSTFPVDKRENFLDFAHDLLRKLQELDKQTHHLS